MYCPCGGRSCIVALRFWIILRRCLHDQHQIREFAHGIGQRETSKPSRPQQTLRKPNTKAFRYALTPKTRRPLRFKEHFNLALAHGAAKALENFRVGVPKLTWSSEKRIVGGHVVDLHLGNSSGRGGVGLQHFNSLQ